MENVYTVLINGRELGNINKIYADKCMEKNNLKDIDELIIFAIEKYTGKKIKNIEVTINDILSDCKVYGYNTVCDLLMDIIIRFSRDTFEICKNCNSYLHSICAYKLIEVSPFEKGCKGWQQKTELKIDEYTKYLIKNSTND